MTVRKLFDEAYYLAQNPDIAAAKIDPFQHYMDIGWRENRDPNKFFSSGFYTNFNTDLKEDGTKNPLQHYVEFGVQELRDPSPFFDTSYYLENNLDVANGSTNPLEHFWLFGNTEGRSPTANFDIDYYLSNNPDVAAAVNANFFSAFEHFITFGHKERRDPSENFNTNLYLELYPDVGASSFTAFEHYEYFGRNEKRRPDDVYTIPEGNTAIIAGTSFAETLTGSSGDDIIQGAGGNDVIRGNNGNDTLTAGSGNDQLYGDNGNDTLTANSGNNKLIGGAGDDVISAGTGTDLITAGAGDDTINLANSSSDTLIYSGHTSVLNGSDTISTFQSNDIHDFSVVLSGGAISNLASGIISIASVTTLADQTTVINLTDENVYIAEVANKADIDTAADIVTAFTATDGVLDAITVAADADAILLVGGADDDTTQYLYGLNNNSTAAIIADEVALLATITTDITNGIRGLSTDNFSFAIKGDSSNDTLIGTSSDDQIISGNGNDTINGLAGNDIISLGSGVDTLIFSGLGTSTNGSDTISLFQQNDKYDFSSSLTNGSIQNLSQGRIILAETSTLTDHNSPIQLKDNELYIAKVPTKAMIDSTTDIIFSLTDTLITDGSAGLLDAIDIDANASAILMLSGSDDDATHYFYGIINDNDAAIKLSEVNLMATITTDLANGIEGYSPNNFLF